MSDEPVHAAIQEPTRPAELPPWRSVLAVVAAP